MGADAHYATPFADGITYYKDCIGPKSYVKEKVDIARKDNTNDAKQAA